MCVCAAELRGGGAAARRRTQPAQPKTQRRIPLRLGFQRRQAFSRMGFFSRTYCCCAVPLCESPLCVRTRRVAALTQTHTDNVGIYAILAQFAVIAFAAGILTFATPDSESLASSQRTDDAKLRRAVQSSRSPCRAGVPTSSARSASSWPSCSSWASSASTATTPRSSGSSESRRERACVWLLC